MRMAKGFVVREIEGSLYFDSASIVKEGDLAKIDNQIRLRILRLLSKEPMYPAQVARSLKMHEQKVYYHINKLLEADAVTVTEKKEIRGTTAKKLIPRAKNFIFSLGFEKRPLKDLLGEARDQSLESFLFPFIRKDVLNTRIVVGSPDPHGPFKARARDGHYAIDLALFLGNLCSLPKDFSTQLDVDTNLKSESNLILVGGPVTNLAVSRLNKHLPARFLEEKGWGIRAREFYTDDNIGMVARIENPFNSRSKVIVVAGIRYSGTKTAVLGLTRFSRLVLSRWGGQKSFCCLLQGYDLDGDGKVDSVELLE